MGARGGNGESKRGGNMARNKQKSKLSKRADGCGTLAYINNKQGHHASCPRGVSWQDSRVNRAED